MRESLTLALILILVVAPLEFGEYDVAITLNRVKALINGDELLLPPPWFKKVSAEGVKVGIVDTGIDLSHPDMPAVDEDHFRDFTDPDKKEPYDDVGHGTHVAGIITGTGHPQWNPIHAYFPFGCVGIAEGVELYVAKALEKDYDENGEIVGKGSIDSLIKAIEWLMDPDGDGNTSDAVDLINLSLGVVVENGLWGIVDSLRMRKTMKDLEQIIERATKTGTVFVMAAGNHEVDGDPEIVAPADMSELITVGGVDHNGNLCDFSNWGNEKNRKPDLVAPAVVASTYPMNLDRGIRDGYVGLGGTSMAAPVVTGAIAVLMASNSTLMDWTPDLNSEYVGRTSYIKDILMDNCRDLGDEGWDESYGYGLLDLYACFQVMGDSDLDWNWHFFIALALTTLIICAAIYFMLRRKRRKEMEGEEEWSYEAQ